MKILRLLILLIGVITLHPLCTMAGQITHTVTYDPSKLSITYDTIDGNAYARVKYQGLNSYNQTGLPELPCDVLMLSVPYNAANFSVNYGQTTFIDININANVYPSQEPRAISDTTEVEFTLPNSAIYNSSSFYQ